MIKKNKSIQNQKILKKTSELMLNFRDLEWKLLNIFHYVTIFNKNIIK
jgi:hypothetical protein